MVLNVSKAWKGRLLFWTIRVRWDRPDAGIFWAYCLKNGKPKGGITSESAGGGIEGLSQEITKGRIRADESTDGIPSRGVLRRTTDDEVGGEDSSVMLRAIAKQPVLVLTSAYVATARSRVGLYVSGSVSPFW